MRLLNPQKLLQHGLKATSQHRPCSAFFSRGVVSRWLRHSIQGVHATATSACLSTTSTTANQDELVLTELNEEKGVATITMNRPPVNSLSLEMFQALSASIKQVESNQSMQAMVLSSSAANVFSAGLDITEMYKPDPVRLQDFWSCFQQCFMDLYGSRLACIAAMEGHAPAAGCMLALSCDYRILTKTSCNIGLNETKLGIVAPPWLGQLYHNTIGHREAEKALQLGTLFDEHEALQVGLVDELALHSQVVKRAHEVALQWSKISAQARYESKMLFRQKYIDELQKNRQEDLDRFCSFVQQESVQHNIGLYLDSLKKKSKK